MYGKGRHTTMLRMTAQPFRVFFSVTVKRNHIKLRVIIARDIVNGSLNLGTSGSFSFGVINFLAFRYGHPIKCAVDKKL